MVLQLDLDFAIKVSVQLNLAEGLGKNVEILTMGEWRLFVVVEGLIVLSAQLISCGIIVFARGLWINRISESQVFDVFMVKTRGSPSFFFFL